MARVPATLAAWLLSAACLLGAGAARAQSGSHASASSGPERVYIVQPGDSISSIAAHLHVTVPALAARNYLTRPYRLRIGRRLRLPDGVPPAILRTLPRRDAPPGTAGASASTSSSSSSSSGASSTGRGSSGSRGARGGGSAADHVYIVQPGDTLSSIAARLHVRTVDLAARNYLTLPYRLRIGRRLRLPDGVPPAVYRTLPLRE